jgi:hypothetical protein
MPKRLLDSNVLYPYYRGKRRSISQPSVADAQQWAQKYAALIGYGVIATPIYLEFLCGVTDRDEMKLAIAFLDGFEMSMEGECKNKTGVRRRIMPEEFATIEKRDK